MSTFALWQQNHPGYEARMDRAFLSSFMSEGVLSPADGHLAVSERSAGANMSVDVAAGRCVVDGDETADQESYLAVFDDATNLTVASADPDNPRKDRVIVRIEDSAVSGTSDGPVREVLTGTAESSPSAPAVPDSAVSLAIIDVAASAASITDANITDDRSEGALAQAPWDEAARNTGVLPQSPHGSGDHDSSVSDNPHGSGDHDSSVADNPHGSGQHDNTVSDNPHGQADHDSSVPRIATGSYTGDGTSSQTISVGFTPSYVTVHADATESNTGIHASGFTASQSEGTSFEGDGDTFAITTSFKIVSGGFQVGDRYLNGDAKTYRYVAFA